MIINGFGGKVGGIGDFVLLDTISGTLTWTYTNSGSVLATLGGGSGTITRSAPTGDTLTCTISELPRVTDYEGYGFKAIQYVPEVVTSSITSGTFKAFTGNGTTANTNYPLCFAIGMGVKIYYGNSSLTTYRYLLGRGNAVYTSTECNSATANKYYGHVQNFSTLTWSKVGYATYTADQTVTNIMRGDDAGSFSSYSYATLGVKTQGGYSQWFLRGLDDCRIESSNSAPEALFTVAYGGDNYNTTIPSSGNKAYISTNYYSTSYGITFNATSPPALSVAVKVYGLSY